MSFSSRCYIPPSQVDLGAPPVVRGPMLARLFGAMMPRSTSDGRWYTFRDDASCCVSLVPSYEGAHRSMIKRHHVFIIIIVIGLEMEN